MVGDGKKSGFNYAIRKAVCSSKVPGLFFEIAVSIVVVGMPRFVLTEISIICSLAFCILHQQRRPLNPALRLRLQSESKMMQRATLN